MVYYQKKVAIKSLKNTAFDGVLKGVLEEAQTMQRLSHNYIVKMYGISLPFKEEPLKLVRMGTKINIIKPFGRHHWNQKIVTEQSSQ